MKILDDIKTFDYIKNTNCSISRFGDGEVMCFMLGNCGIKNDIFEQKYSDQLRNELLNSFFCNDPNILICTYPCLTREEFDRLIKFTPPSSVDLAKKLNFAFNYLFNNSKNKIDLIGDAFCFRKNRCTQEDLDLHKKKLIDYFKNKKLLLVSSDSTDIELEYFLCKSSDHILIPKNNAYNEIDDIENKIIEKYNKKEYDLVLISAGPTASVLVYRLLKNNIRSFDVGQIKRWCKK